jgi:hypothetical protein
MHPALSMLSPEFSQLMLLLGVKSVLDQHTWIRRWIQTDFCPAQTSAVGLKCWIDGGSQIGVGWPFFQSFRFSCGVHQLAAGACLLHTVLNTCA